MVSKRLTRMVAVASVLGVCVLPSRVDAANPATLAFRPSHVQPNVGWMTIRPRRARVGQMVTISGKTHGSVQFLPPLVLLQTARTHVVQRNGVPICGGTQSEPIGSAVVVRGGGGAGSKSIQKPPIGTAWRVSFRVPAQLRGSTGDGKDISVSTPPGQYFLAAVAVGMDFCVLKPKSSSTISVGRLQVIP